MGRQGTETEFEFPTIERLEHVGYTYVPGEDLERDHKEVVLRGRLEAYLRRAYPDLPAPPRRPCPAP